MPWNHRVRLYYRTFSHFLHVLAGDAGLLNFGQEPLCRSTVASLPTAGRWLDVGCGIGGPACLLGRELPQVEITGINITEHQIEQATQRAIDQRLDRRVRFQHGDACKMPFEADGLFDGLYSIESAFHYPSKLDFAKEAYRVLRPGGAFACADLVRREGCQPRLGDRLVTSLFFNWFGAFKTLTSGDWRQVLETAGFRHVETRDVTESHFGPGLQAALEKIEERRSELRRHYTPFSIAVVRWCYRWLLKDLANRPIQYALLRAVK